jgi:hypothetical protein
MQAAIPRLHKVIDEYAASIKTCGRDKRPYVLSLLAEQFCEGLATLAEELTDENGSGVHGCAENLIDEIKVMFLDAETKADDRRTNPSEPSNHSTINTTSHGLTSAVARV